MSQRVYLFTIAPDLVDAMKRAILADEERFAEELRKLRARAAQHLSAVSESRRCAAMLDRAKFEKAGRLDDYHLYTALRPYVIADPSSKMNDAVRSVRHAATEEAVSQEFSRQLAPLNDFLRDDITGADDGEGYDDWEEIDESLRRLRGMYRAAKGKVPFVMSVRKTAPFGESMTIVLDETESERFEGRELVETYGFLLGATLGRIAGLAEPSWWMGRNFWLGPMVFHSLGLRDRFVRRRMFLLREKLAAAAGSPASLFDEVSVAGFEEGFPLMCEGYSSGLYFSPQQVASIHEVMLSSQREWIALAAEVSGYEEEITTSLYSVVLEAFAWARAEGFGLMEGDDLVGAYGFR